MFNYHSLFLFFLAGVLYTCTNDNLDDLIKAPDIPNATMTGMGGTTTSSVSLSNDIVPILRQHDCLTCHSAARQDGNINLQTYSALKAVALNGMLYGTVSYAPGYPQMPLGEPKLSANELSAINEWIKNGALNN